MGKDYKYKFDTKEDNQFNDFLNKTIIGTSYNYFNNWKEDREYLRDFKDDIVVESSDEVSLLKETDNKYLKIALKSLTKNEWLVISFIFDEHLKAKEIAKRMKINSNTVYIIKNRALRKIGRKIKEEMRK